ncbi:hypothetical protein [Methanocalculus natronophilus]|uniref:hypothetical protein n=1 Tax=Methanocalculus natronophilus TaxID=1262400 RepID=UPI0031B61303
MVNKELNEARISGDSQRKLSRDDLLEISSAVISELRQKAVSGRFRSPDTEKMRDAKTRLLIQGIQVYGSILKDCEYDEILKRITALEEAKK